MVVRQTKYSTEFAQSSRNAPPALRNEVAANKKERSANTSLNVFHIELLLFGHNKTQPALIGYSSLFSCCHPYKSIKKEPLLQAVQPERMGFEPMIRFPVYTISSRAPSAKLGHLSSTTILIIPTALVFVNAFRKSFYVFSKNFSIFFRLHPLVVSSILFYRKK